MIAGHPDEVGVALEFCAGLESPKAGLAAWQQLDHGARRD